MVKRRQQSLKQGEAQESPTKKRRQQEGANELCADHRGPQTLQKRFDPRENRGRVQMCRSGENEDRGLN